MKAHRHYRGLSLVEVMVATAVIGVILSLTTALYLQLFGHYAKTSSDVDAQSDARQAMGRVTQALRQAMVNPNDPNAPPPVSYPTPNGNPTPPVANSVTFTEAAGLPADADYRKITTQTVTIQLTATPPPGHLYPDLVINTFDANNTLTASTTVGRDVKSFAVMPVTQSIFDIQITTAPPIGMAQNSAAGVTAAQFTLNSRIFISYYQ
ncbi:MAG TPA: prepilin-type N-terminal cleavage/methylation domain-containing protein [Candidatus Eremiobacteraceae bacterium]